MRRLAFAALVTLGAGSLLFDLTLSWRLPSDADWAEAAAAVRAEPLPVQLWPAWAERARMFFDGEVLVEEDPLHADDVGIERFWVVSLPRVPWFRPLDLSGRGATREGEPRRFGALELQRWDLHAAPSTWLTPQSEWHEVDYVARRCLEIPIGARFQAHGEGTALHVRAGVIGERAYDAGRPPVAVQIFAGGAPLGTLEVPRTARDGEGFRRFDAPVAASDFVFAVSSPDRNRPFCLQAWVTR